MAKQILDDEDTSPESIESLAENDSESEPSDKDVVDAASTKLDPDMQAMSDELEAARPSDKDVSPSDDDTSDDEESDDSNSNDDDSDDSHDSPKQDVNPEVARLQALLDKATGKTPVDARMNTSDAINALLGKQDADLEAAKKRRDQLNLLAGLTQAGQTFAQAFSPRANLSNNPGVAAAIRKQAELPVQDVLLKNQVHVQALKDNLEQQQLANEMSRNDPNSDVSKLAVQLAQQSAPGLQIKPGMTAANLDKILPGIEKSADRQLQRQNVKAIADQNNLTKQMMFKDRAESKAASQQQAADQKQTQALTQTQQMLESARGNPEVQQALKDRYAASKANALIGENYDPNNMSPAQVHLLASEVGKIATGGVPSVAEMDALTPQTINSKLAGVSQALTNKPSAANAGAFIKQYQNYLNDLNKNAQGVIDDKFGRVIETRKGALGDDNYKTLKDQYMKPPMIQSAPKSTAHSQDSAAVAWAKANPSDPRSAKILQVNGM